MSEIDGFDVEGLVHFEMSSPMIGQSLVVVLWQRPNAGGFAISCGTGRYDKLAWSETSVSDESATSLMASFEALRLPIVPDSVFGVDGTNYRLKIHRGFNATELAWWSEPPSQWKSLMPVVQRLLDLAGLSAEDAYVLGE